MKQRTERWQPIPFRDEAAPPPCRPLMVDGQWQVSDKEAERIAEERKHVKPPVEQSQRDYAMTRTPLKSGGVWGAEKR